MGNCGFVFQDEREKSRMLLSTADDVSREVCRLPMRSENVFSPNTFCTWNSWGAASEGSCVHSGGGFDLKRGSDRLKGSHVVQAGFCQHGEENLRHLRQETGATESPEQQLRRGLGCGRECFSPWICWNKESSQIWSVWTNLSYPRLWQDRGWKFTTGSGHGMKPGQTTGLFLLFCDSYSLHSRERKWRFFPIWTVLILPIKLPLVLNILRNKIILCSQFPRASKRIKIEWDHGENIFFLFLLCL